MSPPLKQTLMTLTSASGMDQKPQLSPKVTRSKAL